MDPLLGFASRHRASAVGLACVSIVLASIPANLVQADSAVVMSTADPAAKLPTPRYRTSAMWDPAAAKAYVVGGTYCPAFPTCVQLHEVVSYTPATRQASVVASIGGLSDASAAWGSGAGYVFGGVRNFSQLSQDIHRFTPPSTLTWMGGLDPSVKLPGPRWGMSIVWTGAEFFIFGGYGAPAGGGFNRHLDEIVKYTPGVGSAGNVTVMGSATSLPGEGKLPTSRSGTSAVWDPRDRPEDGCAGGCAYVFGGYATTESTIETTQIVKYNPATNRATILTNAFLPTPRDDTSAVWDGKYAYVFGGGTCCVRFNDIVRYDPEDDSVVTMAAVLSTGQASTSAVWNGTEAYVFGGYSSITGWEGSDEIIRYTLEPGPPTVTPSRGPERGQVKLTWTKPATNTYSPKTDDIAGYHLFWSATPGTGYGPTPNATLGNVDTYIDEGLADGETRYYTVRAFTAANRIGTLSAEAAGRAPSHPSAPFPFRAQSGIESIEITWGAPADTGGVPIASYNLSRRTALHGETPSGNYSLVAVLDASANRYVDSTCPATMVCHYRMTATNAAGLDGDAAEGEAPGTTAGFFSESFPSAGAPPGWTIDYFGTPTPGSSLWHVGNSDPATPSCQHASPSYSLTYNLPDCPQPPLRPNFNAGDTHGNATTPLIGIPAGQRVVSLSYASWYHTENAPRGNPPVHHDLKRVLIRNATDAPDAWHVLLEEHGPDRMWVLRTVDVTAWQANSVILRFSFDTVDAQVNGGEGWYVDDVRVVGVKENI